MGVELQAPPPLGYEGELDFDAKAWASAREQFKAGRRAQKKRADTEEALDDFLRQSCSPEDARNYVTNAKKEKPQYNAGLGAILTKIDAFMKVGDLAIKSAPESVGLAWAGIRLCLHSVQDDFATFSQYNDACGDMIGILINCTVYGGMYGKPHGAKILQEVHRQVLDCIPDIYAQLLDFNYSMRKHTQTHKGLRIITGMYKSAAAKYKDKFTALKANEQKMREFATTASQQLTQYYQEIGLENDAKNVQTQMSILNSLSSIDEAIREAFKSQEEHFRRIEDALKDSKKHTPFERARKIFEQNEQKLDPGLEYQKGALEETLGREPGTCQWIFKEVEYREWHTADASSMLWISAEGGFGKSYLMGSIIETLQKSELEDENVVVSYFFCKRGNDSTQKTEQIEKSILYQLYQHAKDDPDVLEEANRLVSSLDISGRSKDIKQTKLESNKKTATFVEVYQGLVRLLKKNVFLIIDALDEIEDRVEEEFMEDFQSIAESADAKVHIIFGSRPEGDLTAILKDLPTIDVKGRNEADIRQNVTTLVGKLSGFSAAERVLACNDIVKKAGGQFRYVKPALDFLRLPWSRPLEIRLQQLQEGLTNSYTQALQLTDPNYKDLLKTCLTWALLGEGQVTVGEVMDAFSCTFAEGLDEQDIEDIEDDKQPLKQVEQAGNTFLDVNWKTGVITPRHETVTDYFLNHSHEVDDHPVHNPMDLCAICKKEKHASSRPFVITRKDGHLEIATTILQNLSSAAFWRKHYPDSYWEKYFSVDLFNQTEEGDSTDNTGDESKDRDGADSASSVASDGDIGDQSKLNGHAQPVESVDESLTPNTQETDHLVNGSSEPTKTDNIASPLVDGGKSGTEATPPELENRTTDETPSISLTLVDGTTSTTVKEESDPAAPAGVEDTKPVAGGAENAADTLAPPVEDVADDVSEADSDLVIEEENWDDQQPSTLPDKRYEVSHCIYHLQKVEEYWTEEERRGPQFDRLRALLKNFFRMDSPYYKNWMKIQTRTPSSIFYWQKVEIMQPLFVAASCGLVDLLNLLVHSEDGKPDETITTQALERAALFYRVDKVAPFRILLEAGAKPNKEKDNPSVGPFQLLVLRNPRINVVKLFFEHGGEVAAPADDAWGHMHFFAYSGENEDIGVLDELIKHGGDINCKDDTGETPLHQLVRRRNPPIELLKAFIAKGAKVNEDDQELQKPLYEVCMEGNVEAARLLLEAGADILHSDTYGATALHVAALGGHPKTCQLLIENGANQTKLDKRNRSAFLLACGSSNAETALYLASQIKEQDSNLFSLRTDTGKSPLTKAAGKGHTEVVRLILTKIDLSTGVNEQDTKRCHTPLHVAAMNGSKDIVELLLEHGAIPTITDKKGNTPFKACCKRWAQSSSNDATALLSLIDTEPVEDLLQDRELLNMASVKGNVPILTKLLDKGANLNQQDDHGWTPLQIATQYGHVEAVKLLSQRGAIIGRKPTGWVCTVEKVKISEENNKVAEYVALDRAETGVLSDHPIPAGVKRYYYEIAITEPGAKNTSPILGFGLCNTVTRTTEWMPGWPNVTSGGTPSWGHHGDDGRLFTDKKSSRVLGDDHAFPRFGHGDVMGCAVDFEKGEIFFTRNGEAMAVAFKEVKGRLHPVVGMGALVKVEANFGEDIIGKPFAWHKANVAGGGWAD